MVYVFEVGSLTLLGGGFRWGVSRPHVQKWLLTLENNDILSPGPKVAFNSSK